MTGDYDGHDLARRSDAVARRREADPAVRVPALSTEALAPEARNLATVLSRLSGCTSLITGVPPWDRRDPVRRPALLLFQAGVQTYTAAILLAQPGQELRSVPAGDSSGTPAEAMAIAASELEAFLKTASKPGGQVISAAEHAVIIAALAEATDAAGGYILHLADLITGEKPRDRLGRAAHLARTAVCQIQRHGRPGLQTEADSVRVPGVPPGMVFQWAAAGLLADGYSRRRRPAPGTRRSRAAARTRHRPQGVR